MRSVFQEWLWLGFTHNGAGLEDRQRSLLQPAAQLAEVAIVLDPLLDLLGGFSVQVDVDGLAAHFAGPLVIGPVQDALGDAPAVGFSAAVLAPLHGSRNDVTQRLDLRFGRFVVAAQLGQFCL